MLRFGLISSVLITLAICDKNVQDAFTKNEVTPDVVSTPPVKPLSVTYKKSGKTVDLGQRLAPKDVREVPEVKYEAEEGAYYTLLLTDPDAPSRQNPIRREWLHWLVVNIPGNRISEGQVINEYVGSGPPKDTGLHRYVFLLYKQPGKLTVDLPHRSNTDGNRGLFSAQKFADTYKLGQAVAGNFFQAEFDESVPELHKQLGLGKK